jgi:hypothetical protein
MPYEIRNDVTDHILKHKKKRFDDEFSNLHEDHRYYRKKKKTTTKKKPVKKTVKKPVKRKTVKKPIKKQTKKKTYRRSNKEEEMMIPGVYKTVNKVEEKPKTVKHKTEIMFFPKGKKAKEILLKTGQMSKMYGKQGVSLIKKEVEYAKEWPSRIDKKTEENLRNIEEKYGPLQIKYIPDEDDEKESYQRAKKRKTTKKKTAKRKTTKKKTVKRKPVRKTKKK